MSTSHITRILLLFLMQLPTVLILVGLMDLNQLMSTILSYLKQTLSFSTSYIGSSSATKMVFYWDHLLKKIVHFLMYIFPLYLLFLDRIFEFEQFATFHHQRKGSVLMTVFMKMPRLCNILNLKKSESSYTALAMMHDYGWWMQKMHIIDCPSRKNIGSIWASRFLILYLYLHHYKWD